MGEEKYTPQYLNVRNRREVIASKTYEEEAEIARKYNKGVYDNDDDWEDAKRILKKSAKVAVIGFVLVCGLTILAVLSGGSEEAFKAWELTKRERAGKAATLRNECCLYYEDKLSEEHAKKIKNDCLLMTDAMCHNANVVLNEWMFIQFIRKFSYAYAFWGEGNGAQTLLYTVLFSGGGIYGLMKLYMNFVMLGANPAYAAVGAGLV